jgi:phosphate transport system permease protein
MVNEPFANPAMIAQPLVTRPGDPKFTRALGGFDGDKAFASTTLGAALAVPLILVAVFILLVIDAEPALTRFGTAFITSSTWDNVKEQFGTLPYIYGTVVTSLLALLIATPVGIGGALYITEYAPRRLRTPVAFTIELLAAIPSIVFGLWGFFVLTPVMRSVVEPFLKSVFGPIPVLGALFQGPALGKDLFTGGVILAIMILPTVVAISREVLLAVPTMQREGMLALGATKWEAISGAVLPYARAGIAGAAILGLARALGETMAVTMVIGNSSRKITGSLLTPGYTMASAIANQFNEADNELYFSAVVGVAAILLIVSALVNLLARFLIWSITRDTAQGART